MANHDAEGGKQRIHYEAGIPILETSLERIEREQAEAKNRDKLYSDEQLKINRQQLKVNEMLMAFTFLLALTSVLSGGISLYQAGISKTSANAAKSAAETAGQTLTEMQKNSKASGDEFSQQLAQLTAQAKDTGTLATQALNQAAAQKGQLEEIKSTDRAFIFVRGISTVVFKSVNGEPGFQTFVDWQNSGTTPAKHLAIQTNSGAGNQFGPSFTFTFAGGTKPTPTMIGPKTDELIWVGDASSGYVLKSIYQSNAGWYVYGRAIYDDVFGAHHLTEFCWQARTANISPETITYFPCGDDNSKYNCSDRECEDYQQ